METRRAKVFIVDDHPMAVEFLRTLIDQQPDLQVCGYADAARRTLELLRSCTPDLVLVDLSLPDRHGLELAKDIRLAYPQLMVLVFSVHDEVIFAERALEAGAQGYIMKNATTNAWLKAIRLVLAGYTYLSPAMMARMRQQRTTSKPGVAVGGLNQLSDRELEVLQLLGEGRSVNQIAAMLSLGRHTVQTYQTRIKDKLGLNTTQELMRYAVLWTVEEGSRNQEKIKSDGTVPAAEYARSVYEM